MHGGTVKAARLFGGAWLCVAVIDVIDVIADLSQDIFGANVEFLPDSRFN